MGKTPCYRRILDVARRAIALALVLALIVAPLVVIVTHGPAAHAGAASTAADVAEESAAGGHVHDAAGHGRPGGLLGGHNPADHDHQLQALICQATDAHKALPDKTRCALSDLYRILALEAPRRPPRSV